MVLVLSCTDRPPVAERLLLELGASLVKEADGAPAYNLAGRLYLSPSGWLLLSVPNSLVRGLFQALHEAGAELPLDDQGALNAHISVMSPQDLTALGGAEKVSERGKQFHYTTGRFVEFKPDNWPGVDRVWALRVHSPELQLLRRSYGLSSLPHNGEYAFHITAAIRREKVLGRNETSKGQPAAAPQ